MLCDFILSYICFFNLVIWMEFSILAKILSKLQLNSYLYFLIHRIEKDCNRRSTLLDIMIYDITACEIAVYLLS